MKKIIVLLFVFLLFPLSGHAGDFREATWGMTKAEVRATEKGKPTEENPGSLIYKRQVITLDCIAAYFFTEGKLSNGGYFFTGSHTNTNAYIDDYNHLKNLLTKKYGKPKSDRHIWKNKLFKDDPEDWGTAVSVGHLIYMTNWETKNTEISVSLLGDNYKLDLGIYYESRALSETVKEQTEQKALDDL